ncbi:hypothetical protein KIN20_005056 [Parelaphostrongylus tenuis]|uniref:Ketoreductase domain-containing protein n=1 Tax=Parelaphostrongylus tenuis TaxID=148309 RepID=A0AAD5QH69_PARTN|nr:hypothetical protein KIN20_005056 [Parelaphostrongylus tenuis]
MSLRFDGKVAIVTGAGGGLGRTYALELAKRGCKVVVNDLGGDAHGTSASTSMADKVVSEIQAAGGQAVANYDSVEFGDKIVNTAINNFGRIDIVINNAGILRDITLLKMTDLDWDLIFKVHMKGAYSVTKAAWPYMKKQNYGRVIVTSSNAAIYGNFGQTNYSAAKSGLIGFCKSLAEEGAKYNILVNTLVPTAVSRLTKLIIPESILKGLKPEHVTPLVVYLCHETFTESGKVYEAAAGWYGELKYYRSFGKVMKNATAEDIRNNWSEITDMKNAKHFEKQVEHMMELSEIIGKIEKSDGTGDNNNDHSIGQNKFPSEIKSSIFFEEISDGLKQDPSVVKNIKAIILYIITDGKQEIGKFTLDFKNTPPSVYEGDVKNGEKANATVTVSDEVFFQVATGMINPQKAFMDGKLKVKGNLMLLQKLQGILNKKMKSKL